MWQHVQVVHAGAKSLLYTKRAPSDQVSVPGQDNRGRGGGSYDTFDCTWWFIRVIRLYLKPADTASDDADDDEQQSRCRHLEVIGSLRSGDTTSYGRPSNVRDLGGI